MKIKCFLKSLSKSIILIRPYFHTLVQFKVKARVVLDSVWMMTFITNL